MRSTRNYSRKKRIGRKSLRRNVRKSLRRRGRKSLRRRGRKSLRRRGRKSLRGGMEAGQLATISEEPQLAPAPGDNSDTPTTKERPIFVIDPAELAAIQDGRTEEQKLKDGADYRDTLNGGKPWNTISWVLFDFTPTQKDELELRRFDTVTLLEYDNNGWAKVKRHISNGQSDANWPTGWVPLSFLSGGTTSFDLFNLGKEATQTNVLDKINFITGKLGDRPFDKERDGEELEEFLKKRKAAHGPASLTGLSAV